MNLRLETPSDNVLDLSSMLHLMPAQFDHALASELALFRHARTGSYWLSRSGEYTARLSRSKGRHITDTGENVARVGGCKIDS